MLVFGHIKNDIRKFWYIKIYIAEHKKSAAAIQWDCGGEFYDILGLKCNFTSGWTVGTHDQERKKKGVHSIKTCLRSMEAPNLLSFPMRLS